MTATVTTPSGSYLQKTCRNAALHVHEQEIALHDARQTHIIDWINRAETRLHDAILEYETALSVARSSGIDVSRRSA